jgi:hypothetical protein
VIGVRLVPRLVAAGYMVAGMTRSADKVNEQEPPGPPRVHIEEAAARTIAALDAPSGIMTVVDV